jgi:hypothetical protein
VGCGEAYFSFARRRGNSGKGQNMRRRSVILLGLASGTLGLAYFGLGTRKVSAGPLHIDSTNFAAGGRDVVAYFSLPKDGFSGKGLPGSLRFTTQWKGAQFAFATMENRDRFLTEPQRYAPQFDGHCAWAAGQGYKAPASPDVWSIVNGKLYLNYSREVRRRWERGTSGHIATAEANWIRLGQEPGATGDAEDYEPRAAPVS